MPFFQEGDYILCVTRSNNGYNNIAFIKLLKKGQTNDPKKYGKGKAKVPEKQPNTFDTKSSEQSLVSNSILKHNMDKFMNCNSSLVC